MNESLKFQKSLKVAELTDTILTYVEVSHWLMPTTITCAHIPFQLLEPHWPGPRSIDGVAAGDSLLDTP